jgi:hypothetical protein
MPSEFQVKGASEIAGLVAIYGIGVFMGAGIQMGLYLRAISLSDELSLNRLEQIQIKSEIMTWAIHALIGLLSAYVAWILRLSIGYMAGFMYFLIPVTVPFIFFRLRKQKQELLSSGID